MYRANFFGMVVQQVPRRQHSKAMAQKDLRKVRSEAVKVAAARGRLETAIVRAADAGESNRDIAPYADLSHAKIAQLIAEHRREQRAAEK